MSYVDLAVHLFIEISMRDINRAKIEVMNGSYSKDNANGGHMYSGSKYLEVMKARVLIVALGHKVSFVALYGAIGIVLNFEHSPWANDLAVFWPFD